MISKDADRDLDEILDSFDRIPEQPALSILSAIEKALLGIADFPLPRGGSKRVNPPCRRRDP